MFYSFPAWTLGKSKKNEKIIKLWKLWNKTKHKAQFQQKFFLFGLSKTGNIKPTGKLQCTRSKEIECDVQIVKKCFNKLNCWEPIKVKKQAGREVLGICSTFMKQVQWNKEPCFISCSLRIGRTGDINLPTGFSKMLFFLACHSLRGLQQREGSFLKCSLSQAQFSFSSFNRIYT